MWAFNLGVKAGGGGVMVSTLKGLYNISSVTCEELSSLRTLYRACLLSIFPNNSVIQFQSVPINYSFASTGERKITLNDLRRAFALPPQPSLLL